VRIHVLYVKLRIVHSDIVPELIQRNFAANIPLFFTYTVFIISNANSPVGLSTNAYPPEAISIP
jgi:hypothetical protein